jgi:cation transport ATPase
VNLVPQTSHGTWPRRLLVLRRDAGYLRLHVPPLLYAPALQSKLEKALHALPGVRRVSCDRHRARVSVFYDRHVTRDVPLMRTVKTVADPYLERMEPEPFAVAMAEQHEARRERLQGKAAQGAYLGLLGWAHWHVLRWAVRNPVGAWWAWALLAFAIYTHRRQIRRIPELS